jgi:transposase
MAAQPIAYTRTSLPDDVEQLKDIIVTLSTHLESLHQQILNLRRLHFGATSERLAGQAELFVETLSLPLPPQATQRITYARQRRGRPALPKDLPRTRVEYDLTAEEKSAFDAVEKIGEEVSETLDYTPAKLIVIEHARAKYVCRKDEESTIRTAFAQPSPLPKSNASAGLLAQILTATFADHLPLHRQERIFQRHGVALPRSTLCEWKLGAGELLALLRTPLIDHVLLAPRVHTDDTTMPLIEGGRGSTKTARLWGYLGAGARRNETGKWVEHPPAVVFEFTASRESVHPVKFLKDYHGYLQADAYSGYEALYQTGRIIEVACWAHARRKHFEVAKTQKSPGLAAQAIAWSAKLYAIESRIKERPPDEKRLRATGRSRAAARGLQGLARRALSDAVAAGTPGAGVRLYAAQREGAHALHRERRAGARQQPVGVADTTHRDGSQGLSVHGRRARGSRGRDSVLAARYLPAQRH